MHAVARPASLQVPSVWAIGDVTDRMALTPGQHDMLGCIKCKFSCAGHRWGRNAWLPCARNRRQ